MSKNTPTKKRKKLIAQASNLNLDSAAAYFSVPGGFLRQYWKAGACCFLDIEKWMLSGGGKSLLQRWDSGGKGPRPIEGCTVQYSQMDRELGRAIRTRISDCTVSRRKGNLVAQSGINKMRLPVVMKSLEVKVPYRGEFRRAREVFG